MIEFNEEAKAIEKRNKQRADRDADDFRKVISFVEGRRVMARLMFGSGATDANLDLIASNATTASRPIGIQIFNEIMRVSPQTMIQMRKEVEAEIRSEAGKNV